MAAPRMIRPPGSLITISGIDCAGKSTQVELLADALTQAGARPRVFWHRPGYSDELNTLRAVARRLIPKALPTHTQTQQRERTFSKPGVTSTWVVMALLDTLAQYAVKIRAMLWRGDIVICDRYVMDSALDLELRFPQLASLHGPALQVIKTVSPRPTAAFLLMLPHEQMLARMDQKQEPFPDAPDIRDARYARYVELGTSGEVTVLDATRSIASLHQKILGHVDHARRM